MHNKNAVIIFGSSSIGKSSICKKFKQLPKNECIELSEVYKVARQLCFNELQFLDKNLYNKYITYLEMIGDNFWSSVLFNDKSNYFMKTTMLKMTDDQKKTFLNIIPEIKKFYDSCEDRISNIREKLILNNIQNTIRNGNKICINISNINDLKIIEKSDNLRAILIMCYCSLEETFYRATKRNINALKHCIASEWRGLEVVIARFKSYIDISTNLESEAKLLEIISNNKTHDIIQNSSFKIYKEITSFAGSLKLDFSSMQDSDYISHLTEMFFKNNQSTKELYLSISKDVPYDNIIRCDKYSSEQLAQYFNGLIRGSPQDNGIRLSFNPLKL